jgi:hypothetical protein
MSPRVCARIAEVAYNVVPVRRRAAPPPLPIDHHAVVMRLPGVHPCPDLDHRPPRIASDARLSRRRPRPALPYTAIEPHIPISGRVVLGGTGRPSKSGHMNGSALTAAPGSPGLTGPYNLNGRPAWKERRDPLRIPVRIDRSCARPARPMTPQSPGGTASACTSSSAESGPKEGARPDVKIPARIHRVDGHRGVAKRVFPRASIGSDARK